MIFEKKIECCILDVISKWNEKDIYAISFLLTTNSCATYKGICNFPEFSIGYNTENDCKGATIMSEERWNYAFWSQNNTTIIDGNTLEIAEDLLKWYKKKGVVDVGKESKNEMYNENFEYIGKGPNGYWELLTLVSDIAKKLQNNGYIKQRFGNIPIIIHDIDYSWYTYNMTRHANPAGEANNFLDYLQSDANQSGDS